MDRVTTEAERHTQPNKSKGAQKKRQWEAESGG